RIELVEGLTFRLAYKFLESRVKYSEGWRDRPFTMKHRGMINIAYNRKRWDFDVTMQFHGFKRLPDTNQNPPNLQFRGQSPSFVMLNAQVTWKAPRWFELYLGGENLTGFMQHDLIISANNPNSTFFDTSLIWGPTNQQIIYLGFRFRLPKAFKTNWLNK
ncbi:MAG: TonB-dependent receptor, partial [Bacteroidia bacterium]|nr:TonB-dependent receptor [Bacteroidia bacterium]